MNNDWSDFMKEQQRKQLDEIIAEEKLKPEATYQFVSCSFRDGEIVEGGTEITQILPPIPLFSKNKGNDRCKKEQTVIAKRKAVLILNR